MKLVIKKLVLQSLVEKAGSIVSGAGREMLPVLKNLYMEASLVDGRPRLRVVATDLDLAVIAESEMIQLEEPGTSIIPAKKLIDMVKEAGDVEIRLSTANDIATIVTPATSWSIPLMRDKYPPLPDTGTVQWFSVPSEPFASALKKVRNAISADLDKRPELTLVKCGPDGIFATDGARLHAASLSVPIDFELPAPAVDDLARLMRGDQGDAIRVAQSTSHILFEIANHVFIATKLQVQFPSIQHIVASKQASTMELQVCREDLVNAIKRARITADEETNRIMLTLDNHSLLVETRDKMGAACRESLAVHWNLPLFKVATNWMYLFQAVQDMEAPNIRMLFGQDRGRQKAPILIEEPNFYAIINQLRVDESPAVELVK